MPKKPKVLTDKEKVFVTEYLKDYNAARSARVAGYSPHTAGTIGREVKAKPHIKAIIDAHFEAMEVEADDLRKLAIQRLKEIISVKHTDHCNPEELEIVHLTEDSPNLKAVKKVNYSRTNMDNGDTITRESVEYHDPIRAAAEVSKLLGLYEQPELEDKNFNITVNVVNPNEAAK